jgi:two-component system response regulator BaeR
MLRQLLSQPARVFSRGQLLESVHSELRDVSDRAIDTHIKNLRRKMQAVAPDDDCIASVYGVGYRFEPPSDRHQPPHGSSLEGPFSRT